MLRHAVILLGLFMVGFSSAYAVNEWICLDDASCSSLKEDWYAVFVGTVIDHGPDNYPADARYLVTEAFKGVKKGSYILLHPDLMSGYKYEISQKYRVFVHDSLGDGSYLNADPCRTIQLVRAEAVLRQLRGLQEAVNE